MLISSLKPPTVFVRTTVRGYLQMHDILLLLLRHSLDTGDASSSSLPQPDRTLSSVSSSSSLAPDLDNRSLNSFTRSSSLSTGSAVSDIPASSEGNKPRRTNSTFIIQAVNPHTSKLDRSK